MRPKPARRPGHLKALMARKVNPVSASDRGTTDNHRLRRISLSATEKMAKSTVCIECYAENHLTIGSSFFCVFPLKRFGNVPVLITNRHVVDGFHEIKIVLSTTADARQASSERSRVLEFDQLEKIVYFHDNQNVDLAPILLRPIVDANVDDGSTIYLEDVSLEDFVTEETEHKMRIVEDVLVVGYPQGQWDKTRNLPLFRRGITASAAILDYNGEPKFLIDCAIYPGSSGSPVFLCNFPAYIDDGAVRFGERSALLGVVSSVLVYNVDGTIEEVDIPATESNVVKSRTPNDPAFPKYRRYSVRREGDSAIRIMKL